jgi:hypothetical protein
VDRTNANQYPATGKTVISFVLANAFVAVVRKARIVYPDSNSCAATTLVPRPADRLDPDLTPTSVSKF